jgi:hypothetical protein
VNVCRACGYARDVKPLAVLVDGRMLVDVKLCARCRVAVLAAIEHAADYSIAVRP